MKLKLFFILFAIFIFLVLVFQLYFSTSKNETVVVKTIPVTPIQEPCLNPQEPSCNLFLDFYQGSIGKTTDSIRHLLQENGVIWSWADINDEEVGEFNSGTICVIENISFVVFFNEYMPCNVLYSINLKPKDNIEWRSKEFNKIIKGYKSKYKVLSDKDSKIVLCNSEKAIVISKYEKIYYRQYRYPQTEKERDKFRFKKAIAAVNGMGFYNNPDYFQEVKIPSFEILYIDINSFWESNNQQMQINKDLQKRNSEIKSKIENGY